MAAPTNGDMPVTAAIVVPPPGSVGDRTAYGTDAAADQGTRRGAAAGYGRYAGPGSGADQAAGYRACTGIRTAGGQTERDGQQQGDC
jgi:hypothetical protein